MSTKAPRQIFLQIVLRTGSDWGSRQPTTVSKSLFDQVHLPAGSRERENNGF